MRKALLKHPAIVSCMIIILFIALGFISIFIRNTSYVQKVSSAQSQQLVSLAIEKLTNSIEAEANEQQIVAKVMASDYFLESWLTEETGDLSEEDLSNMTAYLNSVKQEYGYDVVFLVSAKSLKYYYDGGLNKTLSPDDEFDSWYYNFIHTGGTTDVQVDHSEVNDYTLELFVYYRVLDSNGNLLGVIGSGKRLSSIEEKIRKICTDVDLDVYIINTGKLSNSFTWETQYFKTPDDVSSLTEIPVEQITTESNEPITTRINRHTYVQVTHDALLHWNFIILKDTSDLAQTYSEYIAENIIIILVTMAGCIAVTVIVTKWLNERIRAIENIDELTGLANNRLFSKRFDEQQAARKDEIVSMVMLDIDDFKQHNDNYGHLHGNTVLNQIGGILKESVKGHGFFGRWGGDEFVGYLLMTPEEAAQIIENIRHRHKNGHPEIPVTLSAGITVVDRKDSLDDALSRADAALYTSKNCRKNCTTIYTSACARTWKNMDDGEQSSGSDSSGRESSGSESSGSESLSQDSFGQDSPGEAKAQNL
jgi:diguanylate cyclase (GGDEF)-like protein